MHAPQLLLLLVGELGLLAAQLPPGPGDGHALARAQPDEIRLELGEGSEDVEEHLSHRVGRVVDARSQRQLDPPCDQRVGDAARIRDGPGQTIELGHDEGIAAAHGGERLVETGAGPVRAGQTVIGVDPLRDDAEFFEGGLLRGEVLFVGGAAGVADQGRRHDRICTLAPPSMIVLSYHSSETASCEV